MTRAQLAEVWTLVDLERLAVFALRGPQPVFAAISGAHIYGFASQDSDADLRGAFLHPLIVARTKPVVRAEPRATRSPQRPARPQFRATHRGSS